MKPAPYNMLLEAASRYNILTLTTSCATACVFCSHHQNPKEIEAYYINKLTKEEAENLVEFLDKDSKITIGESATRICEGEPFAFEYIMDILRLIRRKYPNTPIQITTSGIHLDESTLKGLQAIQNIELNLSINSSSEEGRKKLYGGKAHMKAIAAVGMLKQYGIRFNGSIVAMPHAVGWQDLEETIAFLDTYGAATIRVFVPGYTKYTKIALPEENVGRDLENMAKALRSRVKTPIIVEPARINDLEAVIEGVIPDSPAYRADLKSGDKIIAVNGKAVYSRVDAYNKLFAAASPEVSYIRAGRTYDCVIEKKKNSSSGLVFNYDIDPERAERIKRKVEKFTSKQCLMMVSELGFGIMKKVLEGLEELEIRIAKNDYFRGNIMCAGLLVLQDIEEALKLQDQLPEVLFLPQVMFDEKGHDLTGRHYMELEEKYGANVVVM